MKSKKISIRVDEAALQKINAAKELGYTQSSYMQSLIMDQPIADLTATRKLLTYICNIQTQLEFCGDDEIKNNIRKELDDICHALK